MAPVLDVDSKKSNDAQELKIYPLDEQEYIGTIEIEENFTKAELSTVQTIIILDTSGSMQDSARRMANEVLPLFISKLLYEQSHVFHLIEFETTTYWHSVTAERMKKLLIEADGGSALAPALKKCIEVFKTFTKNPVRILTISDGELMDLPESERATKELLEFLKTKNFAINSQAVRLFTSSEQPDTSALCSLLQINNITTTHLIDISTSESNESIANKMANLFKADKLSDDQSLASDTKVIFKFPWQSTPTYEITLVPGENLFWFKGLLPNAIKIGTADVQVSMQAPLNLVNFQALMDGKLFYIVDHMKVLKIVGTDEANRTIKRIVDYFQEKETVLVQKSTLVRFLKIDSTHRMRISNLLASIEKDNVKLFNSSQNAEYLRKSVYTKDKLNMARGAFFAGFFDDLVNKSFKIMIAFLLVFAVYKIFT